MKETIAILGGGNGAHAAAADLTFKGFNVRLYEDERFISNIEKVKNSKEIELVGAAGEGVAKLEMVTSNIEEALDGVKYILIAVPAFAHKDYATKLVNHVVDGQIIFLLPGSFGSLVFWDVFQKNIPDVDICIAETHTLPYATRLMEPGKSMVMSRFNTLYVGVMPAKRTEEIVKDLSKFYDGLKPSESIISCGMSSINPTTHVPGVIMNTGRIEFAKGEFWFYKEGVTPAVARVIEVIDNERMAILEKLGYSYENVIKGIGNQVKSDDVYEVIRDDENFAKIKGPADTKNRYFSEDIPYGLTPWALIGKMIGSPCPTMESMINIGSIVLEKDCWKQGTTMELLGIDGMDVEKLKKYLYEGRV